MAGPDLGRCAVGHDGTLQQGDRGSSAGVSVGGAEVLLGIEGFDVVGPERHPLGRQRLFEQRDREVELAVLPVNHGEVVLGIEGVEMIRSEPGLLGRQRLLESGMTRPSWPSPQ